jgi:hypothetical protein
MKAVTCVALLAGSFALSAADKIQLTSDTELEGQIVQDKPGEDYVVIHTGDNAYGIKRKDIRAIKYDMEVRKEYAQKREEYCSGTLTIGARNTPGDAAKAQAANLIELSKWSIEKKLYASAVLDLKEALAANPGSAEAKKEYEKRSKFGEWSDPCIPLPTTRKGDPVELAAKPKPLDIDTLIAEATPKEAAKRRSHFTVVKDTSATLAPSSAKSPSETAANEKAALATLQKDKVKSGEALAACLDSKTVPEKNTRLGALRGIELLKPAGANISYALATSAVADPEEAVRDSATKLVKSRNDTAAMSQMIGHLYSAYQPNGAVLSQSLRDSAVASLRNLNDRRIYQGILYRVWMELRLTNISEGNLTTRQIDTFGVNNSGNNAVLVPLALPIQFPELSIQRVNTAVVAPATSALRDVTGQDFGQDWDAWSKWVQKQ